MRKLLILSLALGALIVQPAQAYVVTTSGGVFTSTAGATTFQTFDAPENTSIGNTYFGVLNAGTSPGGGGNWISSGFNNQVLVTLAGAASYFGFLWGTNDGGGNLINLSIGALSLGSISSNGNTGYFNITASNPGEYFDNIVFSMNPITSCCFEVDNFAAILVTVPAPASLPLLGLGLAGFAWSRRRKS